MHTGERNEGAPHVPPQKTLKNLKNAITHKNKRPS
jgi:hypothetical protein